MLRTNIKDVDVDAKLGFMATCVITGLTIGTQYWLDSAYRVTAGTATPTATNVQATER